MPCPDDNTLAELMQGGLSVERRREIEQHIDGCASCSSLLVGVGRTFDTSEDLPSASRLGRYEIVSQLGRGAMGSVYSARDPMLAREVALKVLHRRGADVGEARALARLSHPNVVAVYDVGEEDGRVYIAMERVHGTTLGAWLRSAPRSWRAILEVFVQAARALAAAHEGVVHGDFKPDNVLVDDSGRVKVTDFGLARIQDQTSDAGIFAGTPAYMAPEQLEGGKATPASDQFAFATTLHEALYGARAYAAPTLTELRAQMRNPRVLRAPETRDVPAWAFAIAARGVELDPNFRFASMSAVARALTSKLEGDIHWAITAVLQLVMFVFHAVLTAFFLWALFSPDTPAPAHATYPVSEQRLRYVSTIIAVWLAALFFFGWAPLGVFWAPINAYGLFRKRRWALTSTLIYSAYSLFTCLGTPFAIYAIVNLWPLRKKIATSR